MNVTREQAEWWHARADSGAGATLDAVAAVVAYVGREWGDYGYRLSQAGGGVFQVRHTDGSRFLVGSDAYGNVYDVVEGGDDE
jgi:hypothetical protein